MFYNLAFVSYIVITISIMMTLTSSPHVTYDDVAYSCYRHAYLS